MSKITTWVMVDGQWYAEGKEPEGNIEKTGYSHQSEEEIENGAGEIWED